VAVPVSLVKRLRIFVSHPHVEWHETSAAMGEDAFREINETRRMRNVKAKHARERQNELQELRRVLGVRPDAQGMSPQSRAALMGKAASTQNQLATTGVQGHGSDEGQAFMATLDAVPAIGSPLHVHTTGLNADDAFASTAADSTLYQESQAKALKPRHTRISGVSHKAPQPNLAYQSAVAANDLSRISLPENIQAAAIALAVGDKASARTQLKAAFVQSPNKRIYAQAWLECLRACDEQEAYTAAAAALSELHDFVVPPYFSVALSNPVGDSSSAQRTDRRELITERFNVSSELEVYGAEELLEFATRLQAQRAQTLDLTVSNDVAAVLSFVSLKSVSADAATPLAKALERINHTTVPFVLQGGTVLLDVLLAPFTAQQSMPSSALWHCALQACRLLGRADKYEVLITSYSYLYVNVGEQNSAETEERLAEYAWEPTKAQFRTFHRAVDDAAELAFSIESASKSSNDDVMLPAYTPFAQPVSTADRAQSLRVSGQGTHDRVSRVLELAESAAPGYTVIELDLSRSAFLHFDAAVALLNWAQRKRQQGTSIVLKEHGILIQALFEQISMADVAELHPHYF
jgi:ABC-type transporter Mla MlaB component